MRTFKTADHKIHAEGTGNELYDGQIYTRCGIDVGNLFGKWKAIDQELHRRHVTCSICQEEIRKYQEEELEEMFG